MTRTTGLVRQPKQRRPARASDQHTLNKQLEADVKAMADAVVAEMLDMQTELGVVPPFGDDAKRRPEVEAALYLPFWYVYGSAEPDVSGPFWESILEGRDPVTGKVSPMGGPDEADTFHQRMLKLWETKDPPYAALALHVMPDDIREDFVAMRQTGLHLGKVKAHLVDWLPSHKLPAAAKPDDLGDEGHGIVLLKRMLLTGGKKQDALPDLPPGTSGVPAGPGAGYSPMTMGG